MTHFYKMLAGITISSLLSVTCKTNRKEIPTPNHAKEYTITIQSQDLISDTYVSDYYPTKNYGGDSKIYNCAWTYSDHYSGVKFLLKFDYNAIPSGAIIQSAKLSLFADTTTGFGGSPTPVHGHYGSDLTSSVKRITNSWSEMVVNYNTRPSVTNDNSIILSDPLDSAYAYNEIDITSLVKDQFSTTNFGFEFSFTNNTPYKRLIFYSSESTYDTLRPKLVITYKL